LHRQKTREEDNAAAGVEVLICNGREIFQKERVDKEPSRGLETGLARQPGNRRSRTRRNRATGDFEDGTKELAQRM
jgi:hypothetical protein